jgi:methionyl aminopeptidase
MIILKSQEEIEKITRACRIVGGTLAFLKDKIKPGLTTIQIDRFADDYIRDNDAMPAFKGYRGYPANICASVNNEVIHGIPSERVLDE